MFTTTVLGGVAPLAVEAAEEEGGAGASALGAGGGASLGSADGGACSAS